jgi:hypothetical protein
MDVAAKCGAIALAAFVMFAPSLTRATTGQGAVETSKAQSGTGLICDTEEQVEQFIARIGTESDVSAAIDAVNAAAGNPSACAVAEIQFVAEEEVRHIGTFRIVRVLVVGLNDGEKWFAVQPPHFQFSIFNPDGVDV